MVQKCPVYLNFCLACLTKSFMPSALRSCDLRSSLWSVESALALDLLVTVEEEESRIQGVRI